MLDPHHNPPKSLQPLLLGLPLPLILDVLNGRPLYVLPYHGVPSRQHLVLSESLAFPIALSLSESPHPSSPLRHRLRPPSLSCKQRLQNARIHHSRNGEISLRRKKVDAKIHNSSHCLPCSSQSNPFQRCLALCESPANSAQFSPLSSRHSNI